jgi:hydrogenase expression/formation protein HypC
MCLGVPGKVVEWIDQDPIFGRAIIEFGSVRRECQMACTPDAKIGEYVIVHAGIAIAIIDAKEAERTLQDLSDIANEFSSHNDPEGSAVGEIPQ